MNYAVITPARNEAEYIGRTLKSVACQTVKPGEWVIVDDGSSDGTAEIVERFRSDCPWIQLVRGSDRGFRQRGPGVVAAFYAGFRQLRLPDVEVIVKLDADVSFNDDYFERLFQLLATEPRLGITGGAVYEPAGTRWVLKSVRDHVRGPTKVYRHTCFEAIGGLVDSLGWDGVDEWKARARGWNVRTAMDVPLHHYRATGAATGSLRTRVELGYGAYSIGYHPLFMLARSIRHLSRRPYVVGGCTMMAAYLWAGLTGRERVAEGDVLRYVRRVQLSQLGGFFLGRGMR